MHSGRVDQEGGQAGSTQAGHHKSTVRSWALSPAQSLEEEARSLQEERHALLNGVEQESEVGLDSSGRCFLANANEMSEVELSSSTPLSSCTPSEQLSSCTPSSQLNELDRSPEGGRDVEESASRGTDESAPPAPNKRNKTAKVAGPGRHAPASEHSAMLEHPAMLRHEDKKAQDPLEVHRKAQDLREVHPKTDFDPISEFDRAVSARGHRRVRRHRLQESLSPWPPTPTFPSDRGQGAGEESSSQVTDFATAMGACNSLGWWVLVLPSTHASM